MVAGQVMLGVEASVNEAGEHMSKIPSQVRSIVRGSAKLTASL